MNILVSGGAGYIGSHTVVSLLDAGHKVVIVDDFRNSKIKTIKKMEEITKQKIEFYNIDLTNKDKLSNLFKKNKFDGVIHFAGLKAVGESVVKPLEYYSNNLVSTMVLVEMCLMYNINKFVFSSSATVYGDNVSPLKEDMGLLPTTNPYGETKYICERILMDVAKANSEFGISILRYFNPIGAHESGLIGEDAKGLPNNLMPFILDVAKGKREKLDIFGNDYKTLDGTGVRDYIHVMDLAEGHVKAIEKINNGISIYNLGTGKGTSVLELINSFQEINRIKIPYKIVGRRPGDIAICFADVSKAQRELDWKAKRGIKDMCLDSWNFVKKQKGGLLK